MVVFYKVLLSIISILVLVSCGVSDIKIGNVYDSILVDKQNTNCPDVKLINGLDQLQALDNDNQLLYNITFNKVNWECYIEKNENGSFYLIEIIINFNILYEDEKHINADVQNFEYIVALIDRNMKIIDKEMYTFNFANKDSLLSFNKKNEGSIKFVLPEKFVKKFNELKILLGFVMPK